MSINILTYYESIEPDNDNDNDSDLEDPDDDHIDVLTTIGLAILYNGNDIREVDKDWYNRHTYIYKCDQDGINRYLSSKKTNNPNIDIAHGQQYSCYIHGNTIHLNFPPITSTSAKKKSRRKSKKSRKRKSKKSRKRKSVKRSKSKSLRKKSKSRS